VTFSGPTSDIDTGCGDDRGFERVQALAHLVSQQSALLGSAIPPVAAPEEQGVRGWPVMGRRLELASR
jgi:hypothetical protein